MELNFNILLFLLVVIGMAGVFKKVGEPWWGAVIPVYNIFLLVKVSKTSVWWFWASLLPLVVVSMWGVTMFTGASFELVSYLMPLVILLGIVAIVVVGFIVPSRISKLFDHGIGMTLGLIFLPFVFYPILGFNKSQYQSTPGPATV